MNPATRPYRYRIILFLVLIPFAVPLFGQTSDTLYRSGKVFVKDHGIHIYDSLEWRAIQWQKTHRQKATPPVALPVTAAFTGNQGIKRAAAIALSTTTAHPLNNCGVTASIFPGNDSIERTSQQLGPFTDASTNATSVAWYINGTIASYASSVNFGYEPAGLYEIKLVAQNGACTDTAVCYYYITGTQPPDRENIKAYYGTATDEHTNDLAAVPAGGYFFGGYSYSNIYDGLPRGMLIKTAESGCIEWAKKISSSYQGQLYKVLALQNGGYACSGYNDNISYVMTLDALGNPLWTKIFYFDGAPLNVQWMAETSGGGFVLIGITGEGMTVVRTDAGGNVLWTRAYAFSSSQGTWYYPGGILPQGQDIYISGTVYGNTINNNNPVTTPYGILMDLNDADGTNRWTRQYSMNGSYISPRDIHAYGGNLLMNSTVGSTVQNPNNTIHIMDVNGNPIQSTTLSTPGTTYGVGWSTLLPLPDGEIYVLNSGTETLNLQPGYAYHSVFMKLDATQNPSWSMNYGHYGGGRFFFPVIGQNGTLAAAGDEIGQLIEPWVTFSDKLMFKKFDDGVSDWSNNYPCEFYDITVNTTPESVSTQPFGWTAETTPAYTVSDTTLSVYTIYAQVRYECPEFVDSCSFLKLTGLSSVCDLSGGYTYRVHRNSACGEPVQWDLPANVSLLGQTDSTVTLKFPAFGNYKIASLLPFACSPMKDSLFVTAASRTAPLNLGNDTTVCPGSSLVLHAGTKFLSYQWQDGSTDSTLKVSTPGTYFVEVADSCNNLLHDTVLVSDFSDIVVDAGPDRVKCNADTLHLSAPSGYLSYSWSPNYNISAVTAAQVVIDPYQDTSYVIKAEKLPGCFAYDTVHITVNHSPSIQLGPNRSLCAGDSLVLDAGTGFSLYQWNTGAATQQIAVYNKGSYSVKATTADGCISADTLSVPGIVPLPSANLDHSPGLCTGESRTLTAAPGYSYRWSDGSTGRSILVTDTGSYSVIVTDGNGCANTDSVKITTFLPIPSDFLPGDTSVCSYGKLDIIPGQNFRAYLWSTGSTNQSISVSKPGTYWLEATDNNYCIGTDTIQVAKKDCMEGFFIPNAFTPGGASNNLFRPLLFGNITQYEFAVFDRWGQLVFQSNQPGTGWDGNTHAGPATPGIFVWYCRFTLEGQPQQVQKGTVVLIR